MAKRIADKELTDRNWDQEEEGEEAGTFSIASDDVLKNRAIKKAKRRNVGSEADGGSTFKGFKGFSLTPTAGSAGSSSTPFSGFGNGSSFKGFGGLTNGNSITSFGNFSAPASSTSTTAFNGSTSSSVTADVTTKQTNGSTLSPAQSSGSCNSSSSNKEYSRQLTALNCSVRDWITKHVNDNPLCDLNPIFRDYERHLASIERKYGAGASDVSSEKPSVPATTAAPPAVSFTSSSSPTPSLFSFGKGPDSTQPKTTTTTSVPTDVTFKFGQKVDTAVLGSFESKSASPSFSFSSGSSSAQSSLFGAASSFAAPKSDSTQQADENGEEESEEPPKPEIKEVKEEDAFYSKKCKMFYKKDSEFKEKGVGTLHLKTVGEEKTQMLIRADTNLGNILLNIILQSSLPCSRVGKNNVMLVCVPNPAIDDKNPNTPIPLLIRVKTEDDANELLKILEEKKG